MFSLQGEVCLLPSNSNLESVQLYLTTDTTTGGVANAFVPAVEEDRLRQAQAEGPEAAKPKEVPGGKS